LSCVVTRGSPGVRRGLYTAVYTRVYFPSLSNRSVPSKSIPKIRLHLSKRQPLDLFALGR